MYFNNDDALYVLEQFIDSEYFPSELVLNKINYKTDEDKYTHTVMCYFDVNDEVYNNYNKYERSMITSFENFLRNTEDIPKEITLEKFGTSTINGENAIVIEIVDEYMVFENNVQQVQAGEVVKLQKPQDNTFTDITTNSDGVEMGNCSVCSAENVVVGDHICKTIVDPKAYESLDINKLNDKLYNFLKNKYKELYSININDSNIFVKLYKTYFDEYDSLSLLNRYKDIKKDVINFMINNSNNNYNENSIIINNTGMYEMVTTIDAFKEMLSIKTSNNVINEQDKNQPDNSKEAEYRSSNLLNTYKDEIIQDIKEMFPDYKNEELEDAASYGVDYIFNLVGNTIEEYEWKYIEPVLLEKLKVLLVNV
jgi:hypothetical protein